MGEIFPVLNNCVGSLMLILINAILFVFSSHSNVSARKFDVDSFDLSPKIKINE